MARLDLAGERHVVRALESFSACNTPAWAKARVALQAPPDPGAIEGWLGLPAVLGFGTGEEYQEEWRVAGIACIGRVVEFQLEGPLGLLADRLGDWAGVQVSAVDAAFAILREAGAEPSLDVSGSGPGQPFPLLLQPEVSDLVFLQHLGAASGFVLVETFGDSDVALVDGPTLGEATLERADCVGETHCISVSRARFNGLLARFERDGAESPLSADCDGTPALPPSALPGLSLDSDCLARSLRERMRQRGGGLRRTLEVQRPDIRPGWRVQLPGADEEFGVVTVHRRLHDDGGVSARLTLCPAYPDAFLAAVPAPAAPLAPRWATVARVASSKAAGSLGYVMVDLPRANPNVRIARLFAQCTAPGGGRGYGLSVLPAVGSGVVLAFVGDSLSPRPVVLGVLHDGANAPPQHDSGSVSDIMVRTAGGSLVRLSGDDGREMIEIEVGNGKAKVSLDADGQVRVKTKTMTFEAEEKILLKARTMALEADDLTLTGSTIKLEKR